MQEIGDQRNMYEIIYNTDRSKFALKDDKRMAYYTFYTVICYKEVIYLGLFGSSYIAASGLNVMMILDLYD